MSKRITLTVTLTVATDADEDMLAWETEGTLQAHAWTTAVVSSVEVELPVPDDERS